MTRGQKQKTRMSNGSSVVIVVNHCSNDVHAHINHVNGLPMLRMKEEKKSSSFQRDVSLKKCSYNIWTQSAPATLFYIRGNRVVDKSILNII